MLAVDACGTDRCGIFDASLTWAWRANGGSTGWRPLEFSCLTIAFELNPFRVERESAIDSIVGRVATRQDSILLDPRHQCATCARSVASTGDFHCVVTWKCRFSASVSSRGSCARAVSISSCFQWLIQVTRAVPSPAPLTTRGSTRISSVEQLR
jgi:hypothetical protein